MGSVDTAGGVGGVERMAGEKRSLGNNMAGFCVEKSVVLEYDNNNLAQWYCQNRGMQKNTCFLEKFPGKTENSP